MFNTKIHRCITLLKIILIWPYLNLTYVLYSEFQLKMSINDRDSEWEPEINWICLSPRGITLSKKKPTWTKFTLDLCILKTHQHSEFQLKISMYDWDNERKLKNYWIFCKSKENNSAENYSTETKFELKQSILMIHLCTEYQFMMEIMSGNWKLMQFFSVQGA